MTDTDSARAVLEQFAAFSDQTQAEVASALAVDADPILATLGRALAYRQRLGAMVLARAIEEARLDGTAQRTLTTLGDGSEPWSTALAAALRTQE